MNKLILCLFLVVYATFSLASVINPRKLWQASAKLMYKNPSANEPSNFMFAMQRFIGLIMFGFAVFLFVTQVLMH